MLLISARSGRPIGVWLARHFPAMSMLVISDLIEDEASIEIEATAYISRGSQYYSEG